MSKLPELEQRIKERIRKVKNNIHPCHNPIYTETLNIEIETLQWALNEIATLRNSLALKSVSTVRNPFNSEEIIYNESETYRLI